MARTRLVKITFGPGRGTDRDDDEGQIAKLQTQNTGEDKSRPRLSFFQTPFMSCDSCRLLPMPQFPRISERYTLSTRDTPSRHRCPTIPDLSFARSRCPSILVLVGRVVICLAWSRCPTIAVLVDGGICCPPAIHLEPKSSKRLCQTGHAFKSCCCR